MTTQPTNHRAEAGIQLSVARDDSESDPIGLGILHGILALHDLLVELRDDDPEPRHRRELDEDNPDTLADDTVEQPRFGGLTDAEESELREQYRLHPPTGKPTFQTVEQPIETGDTVPLHGLAYIDDNAAGYEPSEEPADRVRLSGFGMTTPEAAWHAQAAAAIHRHDDFGPPWGAA